VTVPPRRRPAFADPVHVVGIGLAVGDHAASASCWCAPTATFRTILGGAVVYLHADPPAADRRPTSGGNQPAATSAAPADGGHGRPETAAVGRVGPDPLPPPVVRRVDRVGGRGVGGSRTSPPSDEYPGAPTGRVPGYNPPPIGWRKRP
jgi:hypothetical protein